MSLVTRCPACDTVFRVVQDQLKVSGGWVRCGHCHEVFNALEGLFELDTPSPTPASGAPKVSPPRQPTQTESLTSAAAPGTAPAPAAPPSVAAKPVVRPGATPASPAALAGHQAWAKTRPPAPPEPPPRPTATSPSPAELPSQLQEPAGSASLLEGDDLPISDFLPSGHHLPSQLPPGGAASAPDTRLPQAHDLPAGSAEGQRLAPTWDMDQPQALSGAHAGPSTQLLGDTTDFVPSQVTQLPSEFPRTQVQAARAAPAPTQEQLPAAPAPVAQAQPASAAQDPSPPAPPVAREAPASRSRPNRRADGDARPTEPGDLDSVPPAIDTPRFMREAERAARWKHPGVRAALLVAVALAGGGLLTQIGLQQRDEWAARQPSLRPLLSAACEALGCQLASPMRLDQLVLHSSQISQTSTPGVLKLAAELHNRAPHPVRAPALELTITDTQGAVLARKILPADALRADPALQADETWQIDARLGVGLLQVAGFSVEIFYP